MKLLFFLLFTNLQSYRFKIRSSEKDKKYLSDIYDKLGVNFDEVYMFDKNNFLDIPYKPEFKNQDKFKITFSMIYFFEIFSQLFQSNKIRNITKSENFMKIEQIFS